MVDHRNLSFLISFILANATKYTNKFDKKILQNKIKLRFLGRGIDCKDRSGLQVIFGQDVQNSKLPFW